MRLIRSKHGDHPDFGYLDKYSRLLLILTQAHHAASHLGHQSRGPTVHWRPYTMEVLSGIP